MIQTEETVRATRGRPSAAELEPVGAALVASRPRTYGGTDACTR